MKLRFHHVGVGIDLAKTVFRDVSISKIALGLPTYDLRRDNYLSKLRTLYSDDLCNCWGFPATARELVRLVTPGDVILLVESATQHGRVPALCFVDAVWTTSQRQLSRELWGDHRYPYVFFFRTRQITLTWPELRYQLGYAPEFKPRGNTYYSVEATRLKRFGGVDGYVSYLLRTYGIAKEPAHLAEGDSLQSPHMTLKEAAYEANDASVRLFDPTTKRDVNHLNQSDGLDSAALSLAQRTIESKLSKPLELTEGLARRMQVIQARPRRAAFRIAVKRLYGNRCAVCGSSLFAPDGEPEVESAHIYPKELDGSDDVRNGICLCRQHHWAFDVGWFAVSDDHRVIVREELPDTQDYQFIRKYAGRKIRLPSESDMAPHPEFLRRRRVLSGFP